MEQAAVQDPLIGYTIGNYVVKTKLGEGGMGAVYLAEHPLIGKKVALKVLHSEFSGNDDIATRFFHEAKAVNDIQHPNIVDILDYGVIPNNGQNTVYFFMEFLDGHSLAHVIRSQAPLPPERALAIGLQIADALGASHKQEIVHRDLKPDNVILLERGRAHDFVKVLDFGIAKLTGDQPGSRRTRTGIVMGTPAYMSPEQCEGKGNVDHRTDIYALGILLYEMLTGRVPFQGEGFGEVLVQHLTQPPARLSMIMPMIPPHVEAVVLKALEKHPDARYPTMDEFMRALADPVGYVESHGGLEGFLGAQLTATPGGYTPPPGQLASPVPGQVPSMYTPAPGTLQPHGAGTAPPGQDTGKAGGARAAIIAAAAAAVVALGIGGYLVLAGDSGGSEGSAIAGTAVQDGGAAETTETPDGEDSTATATLQGETPDSNAGDDIDGDKDPGVATQEADGTPGEGETEEPELVTIEVVSKPRGAAVFVGDEDEPRGKTPLDLELEKSDEEVILTLKRNRYESATRTFVPDADRSLKVIKLDRERRRGGKKRPPRRTSSKDKDKRDGKKLDKDVGLMQPF